MCSNNLKLPIRAAPYRHQREAAAFALDRLADGGGAALLMEMGTGKTLTTIAIVGRLWQEKRVQRLLVVAPLSILGVWEDEFRKFADYDYSLAVLEGTGARKVDTIRHMTGAALQVLVVNYESAWRLEKELAAWKPDMIVCDEGHKIKTHNIAASKALHRLGAKARYRLLLTGTVITNKPMAIAAIGGWLGYFLGGMDGLMIALIIFMVLDYITGLMCAVIDKKLSSAVGFKGICKKVLILMLVGVANVVDIHIVGTGSALRSAVICFYLSNEGLSLLENAAHIGLPIPDKMKDVLAQLHGREAKNNTDAGDGE